MQHRCLNGYDKTAERVRQALLEMSISSRSSANNCSDFENVYREGATSAKKPQRNLAPSWRSLRSAAADGEL
jgi:hypothetical protein